MITLQQDKTRLDVELDYLNKCLSTQKTLLDFRSKGITPSNTHQQKLRMMTDFNFQTPDRKYLNKEIHRMRVYIKSTKRRIDDLIKYNQHNDSHNEWEEQWWENFKNR